MKLITSINFFPVFFFVVVVVVVVVVFCKFVFCSV